MKSSNNVPEKAAAVLEQPVHLRERAPHREHAAVAAEQRVDARLADDDVERLVGERIELGHVRDLVLQALPAAELALLEIDRGLGDVDRGDVLVACRTNKHRTHRKAAQRAQCPQGMSTRGCEAAIPL